MSNYHTTCRRHWHDGALTYLEIIADRLREWRYEEAEQYANALLHAIGKARSYHAKSNPLRESEAAQAEREAGA